MKLLSKFFLISLLSLLLTSCGNSCKNVSPNPLLKQTNYTSSPHINSQYRAVYIMGDSLSDTGASVGSLNTVLSSMKQEFPKLKWTERVYFSSPFYKERSFSNGPLIVEYATTSLGLPITAGWSFTITPEFKHWILTQQSKKLSIALVDILQKKHLKTASDASYDQIGTNYAVSSARASAGNDLPYTLWFNQFQLKNQLNAIIKHHPDIGVNDLFIIIIGGNDVKAALFDKYPIGIINESVTEIFNAINILAKRNVKHIVVSNVPDIGLIPAVINTKAQAWATKLTQEFNKKLNDQIENLRKIYPTIDIRLFDINNALQNVIADYKKNGRNTSQACVLDMPINQGAMTLVELVLTGELKTSYIAPCDACKISDYVFFDDVHSTTLVDQIAGKTLYDLIVK
ncbi:MAG: SGNH/GDSL hydrolase family protein [Rickettsia endosymbiont of Pseudomimeciton antennatum]|nr:SGNH/GDSL hydrolase family protein [Rickettsia endosymbiont of Pseudomimeciton antennatum]